jgi:hypothetical protein
VNFKFQAGAGFLCEKALVTAAVPGGHVEWDDQYIVCNQI